MPQMFHSVTTMLTDIKQLEQIHVYIHARVVSQCDHNIHERKTISTDSRVHTYQSCDRDIHRHKTARTDSCVHTYIPQVFHSVTTTFTDIREIRTDSRVHIYIYIYIYIYIHVPD